MIQIEKSPAQLVARNNSKIQAQAIALNSKYTAGNVGPEFHTHWVNLVSGENGIQWLVGKALEGKGAKYNRGIEFTGGRAMAIAGSMFTSELYAETRQIFSSNSVRYCENSVRQYCSVFMSETNKNRMLNLTVRVGRIQLSNAEDFDRPPVLGGDGKWRKTKPRCKWYLIAG